LLRGAVVAVWGKIRTEESLMKVQVIFYSMYGHVYRLAEAVADGARQVAGAEVTLFQVPELVPEDVLEKSGAKVARKAFAHVPLAKVDQLAEADALLFGTPTRFGNMCAQMRNFLDQTGGLWVKGALVGKVGSVFVSTGTQHGGQETTITSFHSTLLHQGMIIVGVPYTCQQLVNMAEITGGSPYGAGTLAGADGKRQPSENELAIGRFQGRHVAEIARKLVRA
jgi:NAD(P)H dehydrogenase (quinone)